MTTEFLGRPVIGEIGPQHIRWEQWDAEKFKEYLDALFAAGAVKVRWTQYTPFFNDGDSCEFGVGDFSVLLPVAQVPWYKDEYHDEYDEDEAGDEYRWLESYHMLQHDPKIHDYVPIPDMEGLYAVLHRMDKDSGHFETLLLASFGDHRRVTASPTEFAVDEYDHY